jgi:hypothetical protein
MYIGLTHVIEKRYVDRYRPGFGTLPHCITVERVAKHAYTCEHCGRGYAFVEAAVEAFYCATPTCQAQRIEVSI